MKRKNLIVAGGLCLLVALILTSLGLHRRVASVEKQKFTASSDLNQASITRAQRISASKTNTSLSAIQALPPNSVQFPNGSNATGPTGGQVSAIVLKEIGALEAEKATRTGAQQKIDSQLLYAGKMERGIAIAEGVPKLRVALDKDADGRVLVDVKGDVTPTLLQAIRSLGGNIINSFAQYNAIRAALPLQAIEKLASNQEVKFIRPAVKAMKNSVDSEGDYTHGTITARSAFGTDGTGVKVGVISDSVDYLTGSQIAGKVTVLSGQSGVGYGEGEGTAMLEIVNDLAPGAQLYFATGNSSEASFANNIQALAAVGCNIIVDDLLYPDEPPFQDGIVAQAVNSVASSGVLYFSSASNSGNKDSGTSGTWEGDFVDGGQAPTALETGRVHSFGSANYNQIIAHGPGGDLLRADLFWADPLGASTNDYDLFIIDSTGSYVVASSTDSQSGIQDPYEGVGSLSVGEYVVVVKYSGASRFLHLATGRGELATGTQGSTCGHNSAANAFSVAATDAYNSYPYAFSGGWVNPVESYSSDGPRRVFFQANGAAITPGNFSSSGGTVRQKPDVTAADNVNTDVPGFDVLSGGFQGTSAAAPHAAAIAALIKSYNPSLTAAQIRSLLTSTALNSMAAGTDRDSGAGIVMAPAALQAAPAPVRPDLAKKIDNLDNSQPNLGATVSTTITVTNQSCSNGSTASGAFHVGFYWSTDSTFTGVVPFYEKAISGCAANGSITFTQDITIDPQNAVGTHYLGYKIDDENEVAECDGSNNGIFYWTLNVLPLDTTPPIVQVTSPMSGQNYTGSLITGQGIASDNYGIGTVWYQLNGGPWTQASGKTSWTASISPSIGDNTLSVFATDTSGNTSFTNTVEFTHIIDSPLSISINGPGNVLPNYNGQTLQVGKLYSVAAKPMKGCRFTGWTGSIVSASPKLKFVMQPGYSLNANFVDVTRPLLVVTYPRAKSLVTNAVLNGFGRAKDNVAIESVYYQFNSNDWAVAFGTTNWFTPDLNVQAGTNVIRAFAVDPAGNVSTTNSISFRY